MRLAEDTCRAAVRSRDRRFDGRFVLAVTSTGIYCRPSCPARTPREDRMRFYASAAAAQDAGYRACRRCRPDAVPGSPEWDVRSDVVARAVRLIGDGLVDRSGVGGLAAAVGYSERQLERLLSDELGAGPLALARAARAQTARTLVERTDLPMSQVAFAAGFASIRAFNDAVARTYALSPSQLRARAAAPRPHRGHGSAGLASSGAAAPQALRGEPVAASPAPSMAGPSGPGGGTAAGPLAALALRLPFRAPLDPSNLFGHLVATAVPGVEEYRDGAYRSTVALPHGWAIVAARPPRDGAVDVTLRLSDLRDLASAVSRTRRLLDLDADPLAVDEALATDSVLSPLVRAAPGRRVPHSLDPQAMALRAVLGQQVSTAAARTHAARLVAALGTSVSDPDGGLTHLFPEPPSLLTSPAALDEAVRMPSSRRRTLLALAAALASGEVRLDAGADWTQARQALAAVPGIGPWTVQTVAMRALGDPDAFLPTDLGVRAAARALGLPVSPAALEAASASWSPWRAYAVQHLWATQPHAVNQLPSSDERPFLADRASSARRTVPRPQENPS